MKLETEYDLGETVFYRATEFTVIELHISEGRVQYTCRRIDGAAVTFLPGELSPLTERTVRYRVTEDG